MAGVFTAITDRMIQNANVKPIAFTLINSANYASRAEACVGSVGQSRSKGPSSSLRFLFITYCVSGLFSFPLQWGGVVLTAEQV